MKTTLIKFSMAFGLLFFVNQAGTLARVGNHNFRSKEPGIVNNSGDEDAINYRDLYIEIVKQDIEFPEIVWSQAILESGHFTSKIFKENNNFFGMRLPAIRSTVAVGKRNGYAIYNSWRDCVRDYKLYQDYIFSKRTYTEESYFTHLNKTYSISGASYSSKLKAIRKTLEKRVGDTKTDDTDKKESKKIQRDPIILSKKDQEDCDD
jgi:hypothetical protein